MKKFKYDITVIVPCYNAEKFIGKSLDSIIEQDYDLKKVQVIAINDGSTDDTLNILQKYHDKYTNIEVINQENLGVSKSRNKGIDMAQGKYIFYLDSDDTLSPDTFKSIVPFFDQHYDEVDLVTYKIIPMLDGKPQKLHYRYRYLLDTKVYDLHDPMYRYVAITTMNFCVKNEEKNNIFFDVNLKIHEDQKYSIDIIKRKMKIGYVAEGTYYYTRHTNSVTTNYYHAYYLFEQATKFWEDVFGQFKGHVPGYFQAMFIHDISWKTRKDILKPYQYEGKKFDEAFNRIIKLLNQVEDSTIINHPNASKYLKYHFINMKQNNKISLHFGEYMSEACVMNHDNPIFVCDHIEMTFLKLAILDNKIKLMARIESPLFLFSEKPDLYLVKNQNYLCREKMELRKSSYNYFGTKEEIAKFWLFETEVNVKDIERLEFKVEIGKAIMNVTFKFREGLLFNDRLERYSFYQNHIRYFVKNNLANSFMQINHSLDEKTLKQEKKYKKKVNNTYFATDKKRWLTRVLATKKIKKFENVWLYYDCKGVKKDNAYYQFIHDLKINDGVKRYFVSNNSNDIDREVFTNYELKHVIKFDSWIHKFLYLKARKIITAYIEEKNCFPYTQRSFSNYSDIIPMDREVVYLQHGVLHAHMPWKFSIDRLLADREVISTHFERKNLIDNYAFSEEHLIDSGMPRYDYTSQDEKPKNKILFAPSWRNYLVGNQNGDFIATDEKFLDSTFYKETSAFLNSPKLHKILEENDFTLDFKLHPIFKKYEHCYDIRSDRITFGSPNDKNSDYKIFITDYSSFVFDFVYLRRTILYFFPDYDLFKAGMNIYREIDIPFDKGFGKFFEKHDEIIKEIDTLLKNDCIPEKEYYDRTNGFFIHNDNHQCDRLYEVLVKK